MKTEIYSVTHGNNRMIEGADCLPIVAGSALKGVQVPDGYLRDDSGDNISSKNPYFCELTALYWIWKNSDTDAAGLCHYRRYFASLSEKRKILSNEEAMHLLGFYDVLLSKPRNYLIETNYTQYANAHHAADLDLARDIISEKYPDYIPFFDKRMAMTTGHRFNMLITRKELLDQYCSWLFDILFDLESRLDISEYSERDRRVFGFVAERLLDVWVDANGLRTAELPYIFIGNEDLPKKAIRMTMRMLSGRAKRLSWRNEKHDKNER